MNQTWENGKKNPNLGPNFGPFAPNLGPQIFFRWVLPLLVVGHCRKLSMYAIPTKTYDPNSRKWQKNWAQIWATIFFFFFKNLVSSVTRYHGQLSSCKISEKTNDPILMTDGRMDGRTDGRTDRRTRLIS